MAVKTPEDRALADVERAINDEKKAQEKANAAFEKYTQLDTAARRAHKTTVWVSNHPDLPDDFDLDAFRKQLEQPFEENVGPVEPDEGEVAAAKEAEAELDEAVDEDDPFGDD